MNQHDFVNRLALLHAQRSFIEKNLNGAFALEKPTMMIRLKEIRIKLRDIGKQRLATIAAERNPARQAHTGEFMISSLGRRPLKAAMAE